MSNAGKNKYKVTDVTPLYGQHTLLRHFLLMFGALIPAYIKHYSIPV